MHPYEPLSLSISKGRGEHGMRVAGELGFGVTYPGCVIIRDVIPALGAVQIVLPHELL